VTEAYYHTFDEERIHRKRIPMAQLDEVHSGDTQPSKDYSNKLNENDPKKRDEVKSCNCNRMDAHQHLLFQDQSFQDQQSMHFNQFPPLIHNMSIIHNYYPSIALPPYYIVLPTYEYTVFPTYTYEQMMNYPEYYEQTPPEYYEQTPEQLVHGQGLFGAESFQAGNCVTYNIPLSPPCSQFAHCSYYGQEVGENEVREMYANSLSSSRRCRRRKCRRQRKRMNSKSRGQQQEF